MRIKYRLLIFLSIIIIIIPRLWSGVQLVIHHCKNDGGYFPPKLCPTIGGRSHHSNCGGLLTPNSVHHRWEIPPEYLGMEICKSHDRYSLAIIVHKYFPEATDIVKNIRSNVSLSIVAAMFKLT